jgi:hypothetical protein
MNKTLTIFILILLAAGVYSCKKYVDKPAVKDPRLSKPYCNDPNAVNYNWDFPGTPDNSVCFYPTDVFAGVYELHDSAFLAATGWYVASDTVMLTIRRHSTTKMGVSGFCSNGDSLLMTAGLTFMATVDTLIGDSITFQGQAFCSLADTINGTITKDRINDSFLYINLFVSSDTGVITNHIGTAKLKYKI